MKTVQFCHYLFVYLFDETWYPARFLKGNKDHAIILSACLSVQSPARQSPFLSRSAFWNRRLVNCRDTWMLFSHYSSLTTRTRLKPSKTQRYLALFSLATLWGELGDTPAALAFMALSTGFMLLIPYLWVHFILFFKSMSSKQLLSQILLHQLLASSPDCPKYKALEDLTMIESEDIKKKMHVREPQFLGN